MPPDARIYVAGHDGLVGSAMMRRLEAGGYRHLVTRTIAELDLTDQVATRAFFEKERPEYAIVCAAKVGGILANATYPAEFIHINLAIASNIVHEAWRAGMRRLIFLGSSCIYPRDCPQPMRETHLLTGPLEPTNRPYAIAKIAGIELCWAYNRQYGTRFISVMPTNMYGPGDNYNLETSHVLPALIRRIHEAKTAGRPSVTLWGTGTPRREFLYSDDTADATVFLLNLPEEKYSTIAGVAKATATTGEKAAAGAPAMSGAKASGTDATGAKTAASGETMPPLINIGCGQDLEIRELAEIVKDIVGFQGTIEWDTTKPDGTPRKLLDVSRLTALGWRPRIALRDGIAQAYAQFLERFG
jgi:GDP-L-fucose synthase